MMYFDEKRQIKWMIYITCDCSLDEDERLARENSEFRRLGRNSGLAIFYAVCGAHALGALQTARGDRRLFHYSLKRRLPRFLEEMHPRLKEMFKLIFFLNERGLKKYQ